LLFCSAVFRCTAEMQERTQNFDFGKVGQCGL